MDRASLIASHWIAFLRAFNDAQVQLAALTAVLEADDGDNGDDTDDGELIIEFIPEEPIKRKPQ